MLGEEKMKRFIGFFIISIFVLTSLMFTLMGCGNATDFTVSPPTHTTSGTGGESGNGEEIGLSAGFKLKHNAGLADNIEGENIVYDDRYYYFNQVRSAGADPGAWYVSYEDAMDSYEKLLAREKERKKSAFSQLAFDEEYGSKEYWEQTYADKFYMVTTGAGSTNLSAQTKQKYPTALYGLFSASYVDVYLIL